MSNAIKIRVIQLFENCIKQTEISSRIILNQWIVSQTLKNFHIKRNVANKKKLGSHVKSQRKFTKESNEYVD